AVLIAGYAIYYRTTCYASLLHDEQTVDTLKHRQVIALARCTEYLVAPLLSGRPGFSAERAEKCIKDMRRIVDEHLPLCETPILGMTPISSVFQFLDYH